MPGNDDHIAASLDGVDLPDAMTVADFQALKKLEAERERIRWKLLNLLWAEEQG